MNQVEMLQRVLQNDSPLLFLGAGFSLGGKLQNGQTFPTGSQLKLHLITEYLRLDTNDPDTSELLNYNLDKVCEYIETIEGPTKVREYLFDYFRGARPADFHYKLIGYHWRKIYTVNIDDFVEQVYSNYRISILLQDSKIKTALKKPGFSELIKLHGSINNPAEGMTFSTQQYLDSMIDSRDYRFASLSLDMQSEALIILGATFSEINIDFYLKLYENAGYAPVRGKIFLINPNPPMLIQRRIEKMGGYVIKWTTEEFLDFLSQNGKNSRSHKKTRISKK